MNRFFNTAGPCVPGKHYLLASADRLREERVRRIVEPVLLGEGVNRWVADGKLDMNGLLRRFQEFWRENADIWVGKYDYREAAPPLILMAFLQRVVNGGARIEQLSAYMDTCDAKEGWLVIFDRHARRTWKQRIFWRTVERDLSACAVPAPQRGRQGHAQAGARTIHVVGA